MKVFTITYSFAQNCGAMLQAYALKEFLAQSGYDAQVINYRKFDKTLFYIPDTIKGMIRMMPYIMSNVFKLFGHIRRILRYQFFRNHYLNLTSLCADDTDLKKLNLQGNTFITGSDQIWNVGHGVSKAFYLHFVQKGNNTISYAASFGVTEIPEKYRQESIEGLNNIRHLSVREQTGREIVRSLTGREAELVVDPVFLLDESIWDNLAGKRIKRKPYFFVYYGSDASLSVAKKIQEETGLCIVNNVIDMGPVEFINYIKYAEYVVCNSFHALAFSIIFGKKFYSLDDEGKSGERSRNLLEHIGAEKYCIRSATDFLWKEEDRDVDAWKKKLYQWVAESKKFLINAICDDK